MTERYHINLSLLFIYLFIYLLFDYYYFDHIAGTSMKSNPNAMLSLTKNTIFTNVALKSNGDVCMR